MGVSSVEGVVAVGVVVDVVVAVVMMHMLMERRLEITSNA